jgi:tRNA-splicing ligase RtcB
MRLPMSSVRCVEMRRASAEKWPCPLHVNAHLNFRLFRDWQMGATMSEQSIVPVRTWLAAPMDHDVSEAIERLRRAPDVQQIAVMPDVHLASDVCIAVAVATSNLIYPQAVGGDIGCGMLAVRLDVDAMGLKNPKTAGVILSELRRAIPSRRRNRRSTIPLPDELANETLSHPGLESCRRSEGVLEFATLGSGNHFIEIQADEDSSPQQSKRTRS